MKVWTMAAPGARRAAETAKRAEDTGFDGMLVVDSQNLTTDPFINLALAAQATTTLGLGTGVTNPVTRHPAATASAIASVQLLSNGRAVLGIGRGDSALFRIGQEPASRRVLERYIVRLQSYLRGKAAVLEDGFESTIAWIAASNMPKVPLDVAATGPRVVELAARHADQITFAMGVDPVRISAAVSEVRRLRLAAGLDPEAIDIGAYVNVVAHPDTATATALARGGVATLAHFSSMTGSATPGTSAQDARVVEALHANYDRAHHTLNAATHTTVLDNAFVQRFAALGPVDHCIERLQAVRACGVDRFVITGPAADADREQVGLALRLFASEVLPALKQMA